MFWERVEQIQKKMLYHEVQSEFWEDFPFRVASIIEIDDMNLIWLESNVKMSSIILICGKKNFFFKAEKINI